MSGVTTDVVRLVYNDPEGLIFSITTSESDVYVNTSDKFGGSDFKLDWAVAEAVGQALIASAREAMLAHNPKGAEDQINLQFPTINTDKDTYEFHSY